MKRFLLIAWLGTLVALLNAGGTSPQQAEISNLKSEFDAIKGQINSLKNEHSSLESKVSSLNSYIDELKRDRDSLRSDRDSLRSDLDDARSKLGNAISRSDLDNLRSDLDALTTSLPKGLKRDLAELKKNAVDTDRDFERVEQETTHLRQADQEIKDTIDALRKMIDLHAARLEQVKKQTHIKAWVP